MNRRWLLALAALALAACASHGASAPAATHGFTSDRISVTTHGQGRDVILIPGLTSSSSVWDATATALEAQHYRVHVVQVGGFAGARAGANATGDVAAPVAEEIARYISAAHLDHPAVIGHSMGGTIGMMLAARHPDSVGRLMVVDMFPFMGAMFGGQTPDAVRPVADQIRTQMLNAPPGAAAPMVEQMIAGMARTESARPGLIQQARDSDKTVVANAFHELVVTDLRPELAHITAPLTVLYVIPPNAPIPAEQYIGYMEMSYSTAPGAHLIRIEDSYHFIMIDQFDRFMREVNTFLAG